MQTPTHSTPEVTNDVLDLAKGEVQWAQGKITYLGEQTRPILTVVFSTAESACPTSLEHFVHLQRSSKPYSNDRLSSVMRFTVPQETFKRMLGKVSGVLADKDAFEGRPIISFAVMLSVDSHPKGREFLINRPFGERFYAALISVFNEEERPAPEPLLTQFRAIYP